MTRSGRRSPRWRRSSGARRSLRKDMAGTRAGRQSPQVQANEIAGDDTGRANENGNVDHRERYEGASCTGSGPLQRPAQRGTARRLDASSRTTCGPGTVRGRPGAPDAQRPAGPNPVRARVALRGDDAPSHGRAGGTGYHRTRCAGGMRRSRTPVRDACRRQRPSAGVHRRRLHIACSGKLPAPHGGSTKSDAQELGTEPVARGRPWNHENAWCSPSRDEACSRERSGS